MSRHGNRWNVNEVLSLQREYELLEWTVQQIADKHNRSVMSIVYKLHAEGFTASLLEARGYTQKPIKAVVSSSRKSVKRVVEDEDEDDDVYVDLASDNDTSSDFEDDYQEDDSDDELSVNKIETKQADEISEDVSEVDKLTERVWSLETSVGEIGTMVKSLFDKLVTTKSKKLQPLRKRAL
jgi:hypothetical protein